MVHALLVCRDGQRGSEQRRVYGDLPLPTIHKHMKPVKLYAVECWWAYTVIAQWIEQMLPKHEVVGSNPTNGTEPVRGLVHLQH